MLLINLTTIYQGTFPTLKHSQSPAHTISRYHLKYTLTGIMDSHIASIVTRLTNAKTTKTDSGISPLNNNPSLTQHPGDHTTIPKHKKRTYNKTTLKTAAPHTTH